MGTFTVTKWKCDRCGEVRDKAPYAPRTSYTLQFLEDHGVAAGRRVVWKDMCHSCHAEAGKLMDELTGPVK